MGRIKSRFVKSSAKKIYDKSNSELSEDFQKNKEVAGKYAQIPSKKLRNTIVGQLTRLKKRFKEED